MKNKLLQILNKINLENRLLLAVLLLVIITVIFPEAIASIKQWSDGVGILDTYLFYTPEEAYTNMTSYGVEGRDSYVFLLVTVDMFFPILYSLFLASLLFSLLKNFNFIYKKQIILLPFVVAIFDSLENAGLVFLLTRYPVEFPLFTRIVSLFTMLKWFLLGVVLVALIVRLIYSVLQFSHTIKIDKAKN